MSFSSDTLSYKAYTYNNRNDEIKVTTQKIALVKQPDGSYGVNPKQILVKVHSAALNPVDLILKKSSGFPLTFSGNHGFGKDFSGIIAAIGAEAAASTQLSVGTAVSGVIHKLLKEGSVAEYVLIDTSTTDITFGVAPKNLSLNEAASFPLVYGTTYYVYQDLDLKDKKILVLGSSTSVGRYVIQVGKLGGAREIVVTCSGNSAPLAKELGAATVIDYTQHKSVLNPVLESVKESGKFDYIIDCVGSSDLFPQIDKIIHKDSHYRTIVGDKKANYASFEFIGGVCAYAKTFGRHLLSYFGMHPYHYKLIFLQPGGNWIDQARISFEKGDVIPFIDSVHKFEHLDKAIEKLVSNKANGKVVVQIHED